MNKLWLCFVFCCAGTTILSQTTLTGKVFDAASQEALQGVTIVSIPSLSNTITDKHGNFSITATNIIDSLYITSAGYQTKKIPVLSRQNFTISLISSFGNLNEVIISADREKQKRTEVPVAINVITKTIIEETKATRLDMLINKVPGAFMVDLGNEQHSMSIRQPLGYGNL